VVGRERVSERSIEDVKYIDKSGAGRDRFQRGKTAAIGTFEISAFPRESGIFTLTFKADPYLPKGDIVVEGTFTPIAGTITVDQVGPDGKIVPKGEIRKVAGAPLTAVQYGEVKH